MANQELTIPDESTEVKEPYHWLRPFQFAKGQSGNPAGAKKGNKRSLRKTLKLALEHKGYQSAIDAMEKLGVDMTNADSHADLIAAGLLWKAEHGDLDAIKEIYKQTEKPLARELDLTDPDPEANQINVSVNIVKVTKKNTYNVDKSTKNVTNITNNPVKGKKKAGKKIKPKQVKLRK